MRARRKASKTPTKCRIASRLTLSAPEAQHLRDLFGIVIPGRSSAGATISQALSSLTGRETIELNLWRKIANACSKLGVAAGRDAPDFAIGVRELPELGLVELPSESMDNG